MKFEIMYTENNELWKMENLLSAAGYRKTEECYWVQIFENENGDTVVTQRENGGTLNHDPVDRLRRYLHDTQPAQDTETETVTDTQPTCETVAESAQDTKKTTVSISKRNSKMGDIPSVSLPACTTCNPNAPCFKKCYARRLAARRATVRDAYERNLDILTNDSAAYWLQVKAAASMTRFFRWHVSGDIPNTDYFAHMIDIAESLPHTRFLAFTKQYSIVNTFLTYGGTIPANLQIIFSNWGEWKCDNPHNLPTCEIILKGNEPHDDWKICGGNCTECACRGVGCWELKHGETIAIYEH